MLIVAAVLYFVTLYALLKALGRVDRSGDVAAMRRPALWMAIVFAVLALLPVVQRSNDRSLFHMFLVFPLLYAVLFRNATRTLLAFSRRMPALRYAAIFLLTWLMEAFLVADYNRTGYQQDYGVESGIVYGMPGALVEHLWSYVGFYAGLAWVSGFTLWRFQLTLREALVTAGAWGLLVEQNFLGPKLLVSNPLMLLFIGPWTFIIFGMYLAAPYLLYYEEISPRGRVRPRYFPAMLFVALAVVPLASWALWTRLVGGG